MNKLTPTALALLLLASTAVEAAAQERQGRGRGERPAASEDGGRRGGGDRGQREGRRGDDGQRAQRADRPQRAERPQGAERPQRAERPQPQQAGPDRSGGRAEWRNRGGEGRPNWNRDAGQNRGSRGERPQAVTPPVQAAQPSLDRRGRGDQPGMWTRGRPTEAGQRELQRRDGQDRRDWRRDDDRRGDGRRDWDRNNDGRRDWDNNRRDNDRRWDGRDNRRWDNDRNRPRPRYDRRNYPSIWRPSQRFRVSIYRPPVGYYHRSWRYGDILPRGWWGSNYYISDWWQYDLPIPPLGYEWVRVGEDAYLIDTFTGRVVQVAYDIFWW